MAIHGFIICHLSSIIYHLSILHVISCSNSGGAAAELFHLHDGLSLQQCRVGFAGPVPTCWFFIFALSLLRLTLSYSLSIRFRISYHDIIPWNLRIYPFGKGFDTLIQLFSMTCVGAVGVR